MKADNVATQLKREITQRVIEAFFTENPSESIRLIPYDMRPKNFKAFRCCVYTERVILQNRALATLGFSIEDYDEKKLLSTYYEEALKRTSPEETVLTVLEQACKACVPNRIFVTELCQGCLAKACLDSCRFGAIQIQNGKSVIDQQLCKNCGKCLQECPYSAIVKFRVPCEEACPVSAITKDENGHAKIKFETCISCGKCVPACPFGAVHEKSQILDILKLIKQGYNCVLLLAPSIKWQFKASLQQLKTAFIKSGFFDVFEVAEGADITASHEAEEFKERMEKNEPFMTTSCCAAYNELLDKHLTELKPFVSETLTPLAYSAQIAKKTYPTAKIIFASPCVAKKKEGQKNENIDYIINFEECISLFKALHILPEECEESEYHTTPSNEGRHFAITNGVAQAVKKNLDTDTKLTTYNINGLTKPTIKELKRMATSKTCDKGNLIEVMSCESGCIGGNACVFSR